MSVTAIREIPCRSCGHVIEDITILSANPVRHPPFLEKLLARTLLRGTCPACDAEHLHYERFLWTDLPARLSIAVLHDDERADWAGLEDQVRAALSVPFREEGPPVVRELGAELTFRMVFGLEELREKVVCSAAGLDDRVVEAVKEDLPAGATLEAADPGRSLTFAGEVPWSRYEAAAARVDALPGLVHPGAMWVNVARARRLPAAPAPPRALDALEAAWLRTP